jgi:hypothetical protein
MPNSVMTHIFDNAQSRHIFTQYADSKKAIEFLFHALHFHAYRNLDVSIMTNIFDTYQSKYCSK